MRRGYRGAVCAALALVVGAGLSGCGGNEADGASLPTVSLTPPSESSAPSPSPSVPVPAPSTAPADPVLAERLTAVATAIAAVQAGSVALRQAADFPPVTKTARDAAEAARVAAASAADNSSAGNCTAAGAAARNARAAAGQAVGARTAIARMAAATSSASTAINPTIDAMNARLAELQQLGSADPQVTAVTGQVGTVVAEARATQATVGQQVKEAQELGSTTVSNSDSAADRAAAAAGRCG